MKNRNLNNDFVFTNLLKNEAELWWGGKTIMKKRRMIKSRKEAKLKEADKFQ